MANEKNKEKNSEQAKISDGMVKSTSTQDSIVNIIICAILLLFAFCCIIPIWHVLMSSLSDGQKLLAYEGVAWLPVEGINFNGYKLLFKDSSVMMGYANTFVYVGGATLFGMTLNILGGYVLSRKTRMRPYLTIFVMFTMMFNGGLIPTYNVIRSLGWVGTRWSLLIPGCTVAVFMMLMMNAFKDVPESTYEASQLDGAGHIRTMLQIALPQTGGITVVVVLNSVILQWNAWFNASIYVPNSRDLWPLQLWIRQIVADNEAVLLNSTPDYNRILIQYAVIIVATLPILIAFPFFQKQLEKGVISGGVKG